MSRPTSLVLPCIVTEFLSANMELATEEQLAILAKNDRAQSSKPVVELGRILHDMLLATEPLVVRWEQRTQPIFQWYPGHAKNIRPDFAWLAERVSGRFARIPRSRMTIVRPTEMLTRIANGRVRNVGLADERQVFRSLVLTDAFLKWDQFDLHDDDGLDWVLLPDLRYQGFARCPGCQPDVALVDIFDEATAAIIVGDDQSAEQLRLMHSFFAERQVEYEIW